MPNLTPPSPDDVLMDEPASQPAANEHQAALLAWADAHPIQRATVPKDGKGQYRAVPPGSKKAKGHTRVTTFAKALEDEAGLTVWRHRLLAAGLCSTDNLVDAVRAAGDDKAQLSRHIAAALHLGGEKLAAAVGSALHLAMEHAVEGTGHLPPAPWDLDVMAAQEAMSAAGIRPAGCERVAYMPDYELIGTLDLFAAGPWGDTLRIVDYKTGGNPQRLSYAVQLACYAHASHLWTDDDAWELAPAIDTDTALIVHMPAGTGTASIVEVDIAAAWPLAALAAQVRAARSTKTLNTLFTVPVAPEPAPAEPAPEAPAASGQVTELSDYVYGCLRQLGKDHPELRPVISRRWPADVPPKPPWTDTQARAIEDVLAPLHAAAGDETPFPPASTLPPKPAPETHGAPPAPVGPRSWDVGEDGTMPAAGELELLAAQIATLGPEQKAQAGTWARDGKTGGRPWNFGTTQAHLRTARVVAISAAVLACLTHLWEADDPASVDTTTRLALHLALDEELQPGWRTGAVLGALTTTQAQRLAQIAEAFAASREPETSQMARLAAALPAA